MEELRDLLSVVDALVGRASPGIFEGDFNGELGDPGPFRSFILFECIDVNKAVISKIIRNQTLIRREQPPLNIIIKNPTCTMANSIDN